MYSALNCFKTGTKYDNNLFVSKVDGNKEEGNKVEGNKEVCFK